MNYDEEFNAHLQACFGDMHEGWPEHVRTRFRNLWDLGRSFERSLIIEEKHDEGLKKQLSDEIVKALALMGAQNIAFSEEQAKQMSGSQLAKEAKRLSTGIQKLDEILDGLPPSQQAPESTRKRFFPCPECKGTGDGSIPFEHSTLGQGCQRCGGTGRV